MSEEQKLEQQADDKATPATIAEKQQQEYQAGWDEFAEAGEKNDAEGNPAVKKPDEPQQKQDEPAKEKNNEDDQQKVDVASVLKALKDTKSYATKVSQENAVLRKKVEEMESGNATQADVDKARKAVDDSSKELEERAAKLYEDYPELKDILGPLIEQTKTFKAKAGEFDKFMSTSQKEAEKQRQALEARNEFESKVKPEIIKAHPDFDTLVVQNYDEFSAWANAQSPALKTAALFSPDPRDIIYALNEYKKFLGSGKAQEAKNKDEGKKSAIKSASSAMRGGGSPAPFSKDKSGGKSEQEEYDDGFKEAAALLAKS